MKSRPKPWTAWVEMPSEQRSPIMAQLVGLETLCLFIGFCLGRWLGDWAKASTGQTPGAD
jgi:hypothetical protein